MASITVRNLDDDVKTRLRMRAASHGRSMEEEARLILAGAVERETVPAKPGWGRLFTNCSSRTVALSWNCRRASRRVSRRDSTETAAMVVLDTNVVSELMRDHPSREAIVWLDELPTRELFVTAVTEAEIRTGIAFLPEGRRRQGIADAAERVFDGLFSGRVLPFDSSAARVYAEMPCRGGAVPVGRPLSHADGQIAAIARSRSMSVATRNVRDFEHTGVDVVDPWQGS